MPKISTPELISNPIAPAVGYRTLYSKADGWYEIDSSGVVSKLDALLISELNDVTITGSQINGMVLAWNATGSKWEPKLDTHQFIFTVERSLVVGSNPLRIYNYLGKDLTILKVLLAVNTPGTGTTIWIDIHKNNTTIFTDQNHRPSISPGNYTGNTILIDTPNWLQNEYLQMNIDQVGSGTAGLDLSCFVITD